MTKKELLKLCIASQALWMMFAFAFVYLFLPQFFTKYVAYSVAGIFAMFLLTITFPSTIPFSIDRNLLYSNLARWFIEFHPIAISFFSLFAQQNMIYAPFEYILPISLGARAGELYEFIVNEQKSGQ